MLRKFQQVVCADAKAPVRVKAVNTLLNSGYNWKELKDSDVEQLWESLFFALWYAEMGRGCEEIIAAIERACHRSYRLTKFGFFTISKMWYGLDQYRIDKVSHLARHLLPVLLEQQIKMWFKSRKQTRPEIQGVRCKMLLKKVLNELVNSYGLCYFLLEILADEISKTTIRIYDRLKITTGKFELKANLIVFLYKQIIALAANVKLDARLLRTFDQYVIRKFVTEILPNESQLTQILVSLRLYQSLDMHVKRKKKPLSGKCSALFKRWSVIIQDVHEKCINGEFFPSTILPTSSTIKWTPHIE
jgi:hypothetical protein